MVTVRPPSGFSGQRGGVARRFGEVAGTPECKGVLLIVRRPVIGDPCLRLAGLGGGTGCAAVAHGGKVARVAGA